MKEKWTSELLECDGCCYAYRSIHPKGLYELECQNCGNLSKHNKIYDTKVQGHLLHPQSLIPIMDALHILRLHNRFRMGLEEMEMIDPNLIGEALDRVIDELDRRLVLDNTKNLKDL